MAEETTSLARLAALGGDAASVARAHALLWTFRPRAAVYHLLRALGCRRGDGRPFTQADVGNVQSALAAAGLLVEAPRREGYRRLPDELRAPLYSELLAEADGERLRRALFESESFDPEAVRYYWPLYDAAASVAVFRLLMFTGTPAAQMQHLAESIARTLDWNPFLDESAFAAFDAASFERLDPDWRWQLCYRAVTSICSGWREDRLAVANLALAALSAGNPIPDYLRLALAELLGAMGESERAARALDGIDNGAADLLRAVPLFHAGRWGEFQTAFEAASKRRQLEFSARRQLFPSNLAWLYPAALLAQGSPRQLTQARKFCLGEAGKRNPDPYSGWGLWAHVIGSRLGEHDLDRRTLRFAAGTPAGVGIVDFWKLLLAAWLGASSAGAADAPARAAVAEQLAALRQRLQACRLAWLDAQVAAAGAVLAGDEADIPFFAASRGEAWRDMLQALHAIAEDAAESDSRETARVVWSIDFDRHGAPGTIEAFEQKRGSRGWGKAKPLSLARLFGNEELAPWDARVARAIRQEPGAPRRYRLDRAQGLMALVGHPAVVVAGAPEQFVEVVEGKPEIEVRQYAGGYRLSISPPLRDATESRVADMADKREMEALRAITLIQDTPQRLRVIRLTPAQRRAAQLVGKRATLPGAAGDELQKTLRALAGHFQVQADQAEAARELPGEARLRAELSPSGESLLLRLVVAPLGAEGPRLAPGRGRPRLLAAVAGETLAASRDLAAEKANLAAVLDALPFLRDFDDGNGEWLVEDAEEALEMVERLPTLPAVAAVDWPKGKPVRIVTVGAAQIGIRVAGERDWFRLSGRAEIDEGLVLQIESLLDAARGGSRFVPIGDGLYAALTRKLRQQLADLAAVAEDDGRGLRLPRLAVGWLDEALEGMRCEQDEPFRRALERLQQAQAQTPKLPGNLQAELRPYQEDGYRWAMRLAAAGFGACLADDMGLGKTLQALAVLLARAAGGPALVLAPTSVCGNWLSEARRFAPSLRLIPYGGGERDSLLAAAAAGSLVVASYTLFQQAQDSFTKIRWHTVVADEAQAIKNAGAKRSQAAFELAADFRLALSGTPVENRLAELWSIMHFANPGLLGSQHRFAGRFAQPIEKQGDREARHLLRRLVAPFLLRRTKAQVLEELPPRSELVIAVAPDAAEAAHYEALRREAVAAADLALASAGPGEAKLNILAQLTRLRRAACDPRLPTPAFPTPGAKVQAFAELAAELAANGHKALVFSQFVDFLHLLEAPLRDAGIPYQYLDGATPAAERTRRVAAFQAGEGDLFLISLKAGGFGLNLTAADFVVITDPWWNPAAEDQAMGRAHRIGQQRPVTVYRLVSRGTVEERIVDMHHDKRALAESVLSGGEAATLPSTDELIALIRGDLS